jgi:hypothetical protein
MPGIHFAPKATQAEGQAWPWGRKDVPPKQLHLKSPYVSRSQYCEQELDCVASSANTLIYSATLKRDIPYGLQTPKCSSLLPEGIQFIEISPDRPDCLPTPPLSISSWQSSKTLMKPTSHVPERWEVKSIVLSGKERKRTESADRAIARCLTRYVFYRITGEVIDDFQEGVFLSFNV